MPAFSLPLFVDEVSALLKGKYSRHANPKATWHALFDHAFIEAATRFADHWPEESLRELKREVGSILGSRPRKTGTPGKTRKLQHPKGHVWKITREAGKRIVARADDASGITIVFLATGTEVTWIAIQGGPGRDTIEEAAEEVRVLLREEATNKPDPKPIALERVRLIAIHDERIAYAAEIIRENHHDDSWLVNAKMGGGGKIRLEVTKGGASVRQKDVPTSLIEKVRGDAKGRFLAAGTGALPGV